MFILSVETSDVLQPSIVLAIAMMTLTYAKQTGMYNNVKLLGNENLPVCTDNRGQTVKCNVISG